ncbi:dihydroorotate dehydrogenase [Desulfobotulus mexicanus]|uniref:Dihydroorotate dehydrogenase n=1 Tax=Desulfobotulus mexicanus TaxID=2586642 RepID=A0A5Q4VFX3_9BACT|nr:dihydroorotate dehydrogenase [Desulfobotulus mexicanus]TYT75863.1 dihydroorotate dehydrogenase [Desulfobotulus mexicanus]
MLPDLCVNIAGLKLKNPVLTASGTFGYGLEYAEATNLSRIGAIIVKGLSLEPSAGNPEPRVVETASGLLNAVGLENIGAEAFLKNKLPLLKTHGTPVIANLYGKSEEDYRKLALRLEREPDIAALELNISCPNVKAGGLAFGTDPDAAARLTESVRKVSSKPLIVKLSPNVTDIKVIARSVEGAGADALSLINTLTGMGIDIKTRKPKLANITGGLSGPAIKPVALRMVWETSACVSIPVIGLGGIMNAEDAVEFFLAGASAVAVGTGNFINPKVTSEIVGGLKVYMIKNNFSSIADLKKGLILP